MEESHHEERGALNLGCDELLLDPDKLSRLLYEDEQEKRHQSKEGECGDMYRHTRDTDRSESTFSDMNNDESVIQVRNVLPAPGSEDKDAETVLRTEEEYNRDRDEEEIIEAKLPPVRLHKVQSEDLTWLDTIIKHNSLDQAVLDSVPDTGYLSFIIRINIIENIGLMVF